MLLGVCAFSISRPEIKVKKGFVSNRKVAFIYKNNCNIDMFYILRMRHI